MTQEGKGRPGQPRLRTLELQLLLLTALIASPLPQFQPRKVIKNSLKASWLNVRVVEVRFQDQ